MLEQILKVLLYVVKLFICECGSRFGPCGCADSKTILALLKQLGAARARVS